MSWLTIAVIFASLVAGHQKVTPPTAQIPKPSANAAPGVNFTDVTKAAGLGDFRFVSGTPAKDNSIEAPGTGCGFLDYDNDGWLDLLVANGHVYSVVDTMGWGTTYKQRLLLSRNLKGKFFEVRASAGEAIYVPRAARGSATGNFDNDGDLDMLRSSHPE